MRCRICGHASQHAIETAVQAEERIAEVAERFGVSETALRRHLEKAHDRAPAPAGPRAPTMPSPPLDGRPGRAPTPEAPAPPATVSEPSPSTVRSERRDVTAREKAREIGQTIDDFLSQARTSDDATFGEKASLVRAALSANRQLAQFTGELGASESAVLASPLVQRLLGDVLEALAPFPDALRAVHMKIAPAVRRVPEAA